MEVTSQDTSETKELASKIAKKLKGGETLALYGDLGSGKTTFVRYLVWALGFSSRVQSPTFIIIRKYSGNGASKITNINHIDLYRFQSKEDLETLDLEEILGSENEVSIVEWPELAEDYLDENTVRIYFEDLGGDCRKIDIRNIRL